MSARRVGCQASQGGRSGQARRAECADRAGRAARVGQAMETEGRRVITGPRMFHSDPDVQQMKTPGLSDAGCRRASDTVSSPRSYFELLRPELSILDARR